MNGPLHGGPSHEVGAVAGVERLAQSPDVNVDGPGIDLRIVRPHRVEQLIARKHPSGMFEKMLQEPELRRAERDLVPWEEADYEVEIDPKTMTITPRG